MPQQKISLENLLIIPDEQLSDDARLMRHYFVQIIQDLPSNVYWRDKKSLGLGANNNTLKFCKMAKLEDFIGGTYEDMIETAGWTEEQGLSLKKDDIEVMTSGIAKINVEEPVFFNEQGEPIYYISTRIPLKDEQENIQGIVGISTDITEIKKRELELSTYAQIMNSLPGPIYWKDTNSVYRKVNKYLLEMGGFKTENEVIGKTDYDLWPKFAANFIEHDQEVIRLGKAVQREEQLEFANGNSVYLTVLKVPLYDHEGNIIGIVGNSLDITERKAHENKLLIYEQVIQNLPGYIYWKDCNSTYLGGNQNLARLLGLRDMASINGIREQDTPWSVKSPVVLDHNLKADKYVLETGKSIITEEQYLDIKNSEGENLFIRSEKSPLHNEKGEIIGVLGVSVDITERKKNENKMAIYAQIMQNLPGYIYWKDRNSAYQGLNQNVAFIAGAQSINEVIGKTDYDLPWGKNLEAARNFIAADKFVIDNKEGLVSEDDFVIEYPEKHSIVIRTEKTPLINTDGDVIGVLGVAVDITDRKRLEEKQNEFAKVVLQVVHDIRSPLVVIDMLSKEVDHFPEEQRILLRNAAQRINDIANHLIDSYKGRLSDVSVVQKIPMAVLINRIISEKRFQFATQNIEFKINIAERAYFCFTLFESSELQRILSNLINNAVEASADNKLIEISLDQYQEQILLSIQDFGIGMSPELIKRVGEYGLSLGKDKGAGLGLAHAKEWIHKHGGQLQITSELGQGTKVMLKLLQCPAPTWFAQELILKPNSVILIVDDDPSIHFLWKKRLKGLQWQLPKLKIFHFNYSTDLVKWFNDNKVLREDLILLTDNELIGSDLNGMKLLTKFADKVAQAFLVTSHYAFYELTEHLTRLKASLLPKELVSHLPIIVEAAHTESLTNKIEFVFLDDNINIINAYKFLAQAKNRNILLFSATKDLLAHLAEIPKDTPFYIDSQLEDERGEIFAKTLFDQGYHELYLASGALDTKFNINKYPWLKGVSDKPKL